MVVAGQRALEAYLYIIDLYQKCELCEFCEFFTLAARQLFCM